MEKIRRFLRRLGPGLITGAADDDPSGIATYSLAGAQFGYQALWTAWLTFPLMAVIQETCARIGLVNRKGLAGVIKEYYPKPLLYFITLLLVAANIFNIGADLSGMAAAVKLLLPVDELLVGFIIAVVAIFLIIQLPYRRIAAVFKWLTLALFAYILTYFLTGADFVKALQSTFLPDLNLFNQNSYLLTLVAIFGTTISPYLFFWQASEEAEEEILHHRLVTKNELKHEREDTVFGMFFSNLVAYFVIATCGATLFKAGATGIQSASQAATALRPLAGDLSFLLFAVGIIGTGVLAIPVLAGSAAYAVSEAFGLAEGLNKPFRKAKAFYLIIILATLLGFVLNLAGINPIKYLFYSAVLNGLVAPVIIILLIIIANNRRIMGNYVNNRLSNLLSAFTLLLMTVAVLGIILVR